MTELGETITKIIETNSIIPAVASGGMVVWLISNLKEIFNFAKDFVTSLISFVIYNTYTDERGFGHEMYDRQIAFDQLVSNSRPIWERTTNLDLNENISSDDPSGKELENCALGAEDGKQARPRGNLNAVKTYGFSIRILMGSLVFVRRSVSKNQKITFDTSIRVFFSRKKRFVENLEREVTRIAIENKERQNRGNIVNIYYGSRTWDGITKKFKRGMDSIFLDNDIHEKLLEDIRKFLSNRETYQKMNYPYKYSALIYGVPGSGKTSSILAIASELKRDVEYVNISTVTAIDLLDRMNSHPTRIFVFEDIDAVGFSPSSKRATETAEKLNSANEDEYEDDDSWGGDKFSRGTLSLSDLLNITDGLLSSDGTICIFTTNHKEKLDPAFLRAGRMNKTIEFQYMSPETAKRMVSYHLGKNIEGFRDQIKPAELQEMILDIKAGKKEIGDLQEKFCETETKNG